MKRRHGSRLATVAFATTTLLLAFGSYTSADAHSAALPANHVPATGQSGGIVVPVHADVTTTVHSKDADDTLAYGLKKPTRIAVCRDCQAVDSLALGTYDAGTTLVFCLSDRTRHESFSSNDPAHARVTQTGRYKWTIEWDDAGGNGDYNDLVTYVVISPN